MKIYKIKTSATALAALMLAGCGENAWNDKLDGFEVPPVYAETSSINYELTAADYNTLSTLSANTALATTVEEKAELKAIGANGCFASEEQARKYLPAFFADSSFPYFTLNNGSSIKATYSVAGQTPAVVEAFAKGVNEYKLTEADYISAWESDENYIMGFAPMNPAGSRLPAILKNALPDAEAGDYVVANYNEATVNPIFGSISEGEDSWTPTNVLKDVKVDDDLSVRGYVTGISTRGFVVTDAAGSIVYDSGSNGFNDDAVTIGAQVNISGTVTAYSRCLQISKDVTYEVVGTSDYKYPSPAAYTGAMLDAACGETSNMLAQYVKIEGTVSVSGNYINFSVDGATKSGSVYNAPSYVKSELVNGAKVTLTGYFVSVSSGKYFNLLVTGVNGTNIAKPVAKASKSGYATAVVGTTETVGKNAVYTYNGSKWVAATGVSVLQTSDYAAMGQTYGNLSGTLPAELLPIYLKNTYPYAVADAVVTAVYKFYNGSSTSYVAKGYKYDGNTWALNNYFESVTEQYNRLNGIWMFDPSVTMTLPAGKGQALSTLYYQACVNWVYNNIDKPLGATSITSGVGYVTSYGNNEYYSGSSAYQGNVDIRASAAINQYPEGYAGMSNDEIVEKMKYRFCYEVFPGALSSVHADATPIAGMDIYYTFNFTAYTGSATEYTVVYKLIGPAKFEFVSCTWWENGKP